MQLPEPRIPLGAHAASDLSAARPPRIAAPSRFPVVGRTSGTREPIVGHVDHGEWCVLQDGRVASPSGARILAGRLDLSAPAMDFNLIRVRDGEVHSLIKGLIEGKTKTGETGVTAGATMAGDSGTAAAPSVAAPGSGIPPHARQDAGAPSPLEPDSFGQMRSW
jgi:hypothetical protein